VQKFIDSEKARAILQQDGPLSLLLKEYECRPEQQYMLQDIIEAYNKNHIAIIEAGTGIGKSMAYLIPAILWSAQNKERSLISTNTISLQEQLLHKDIPLASKILNSPIKAVLVKGMSNYLCLRKLEETKFEKTFLSDREREELEHIEHWSENTKDGSRSQLPIVPSSHMWEKVCAESDTCTKRRCPFFKKCHFFNARKEAEEAQLLIVNHSMLFADLAFRSTLDEKDDGGLLPPYCRVILDEAHHIERISTDFFADKVSYLSLLRWLARLGAEKQGKFSVLSQKFLNQFMHHMPHEISLIYSRLSIDIPASRKEILIQLNDLFEAIVFFLHSELCQESDQEIINDSRELKIRILPKHLALSFWKQDIAPRALQLEVNMRRYIQSIKSVLTDISELDQPDLLEQTHGMRQEILALSNRLEVVTQNFQNMMKSEQEKSKVMWIESKALKTFTNTHLISAELDISKKLSSSLFTRFPTIILCSATLTTNQSFRFVRESIGLTAEALPQRKIVEKIYNSPFDYQKQALFLIPSDMPDPSSSDFCNTACEKIWCCIQASHGSAFVLFTSYALLKQCYDKLLSKLLKFKFTPFKQGDASRNTLLEQYKKSKRAVLFGTDSFWEGIDVAGDALRCVIIVKLPFKVPTEPLIEARTEAIKEKGGNPFHDHAIPTAIVKFKQGFGRLIRNKQDRGCIVCLDIRLINKNYGKLFLNSLPNCKQLLIESSDKLHDTMSNYYQKKESLLT